MSCCPKGYTFVDSTGHYSDPVFGTGIIDNIIANVNVGICAILTSDLKHVGGYNSTAPVPSVDIIDCPCCPDNFSYSSFDGECHNDINAAIILDPIPCIACKCTVVVPQACPDCGTSGLPLSFNLNPFTRQCDDCGLDKADGQNPKGKIICFLPTNYTNPPINFIVSIKNLI